MQSPYVPWEGTSQITGPVSDPTQTVFLEKFINGSLEERKVLAKQLADCIIDPYANLTPGLEPPTVDIVWNIADSRQYLTILFNQDHFNKVKDKLKIFTVVHKKGDPTAMVQHTSKIPVDPNDFVPRSNHGLVDLQKADEPQKYVWYSVNMTDFQGYDANVAKRVADLKSKLDGWANLQEQPQR
jgi:hypothetical protein